MDRVFIKRVGFGSRATGELDPASVFLSSDASADSRAAAGRGPIRRAQRGQRPSRALTPAPGSPRAARAELPSPASPRPISSKRPPRAERALRYPPRTKPADSSPRLLIHYGPHAPPHRPGARPLPPPGTEPSSAAGADPPQRVAGGPRSPPPPAAPQPYPGQAGGAADGGGHGAAVGMHPFHVPPHPLPGLPVQREAALVDEEQHPAVPLLLLLRAAAAARRPRLSAPGAAPALGRSRHPAGAAAAAARRARHGPAAMPRAGGDRAPPPPSINRDGYRRAFARAEAPALTAGTRPPRDTPTPAARAPRPGPDRSAGSPLHAAPPLPRYGPAARLRRAPIGGRNKEGRG